MSTRAVIKHMYWTVQPDEEPDARIRTYAQECDLCGEGSPRTADPTPTIDWVLRHAGAHPSHRSYTEIIKRGWRAVMDSPGVRS
ncbi:hypothetical protein [Streptomyces sp. ISL-11]|uniref:DUF7848 domain-containing protein n=1 Tax=Streptomyces sp. ISL-11 TaxID=2819174 RepID=UPI0027E3DBA8|nr:hypothetical protein [Streptomyces sp. ISL-11]